MKKIALLFFSIFIFSTGYSQTGNATFGPKVGISSSNISIIDNVQNVRAGDRTFGFHAGIFARLNAGPAYVQPELLFTSSGGTIEITDATTTGTEIREYEFNKIDLPVMVGFRFGESLRIFAGPVASLVISTDVRQAGASQEIDDNYKNATIGYQAGVGLDVGNLILDLKYESNLSKFGDAVTVGNQNFATDTRNNQIILSVGVFLF